MTFSLITLIRYTFQTAKRRIQNLDPGITFPRFHVKERREHPGIILTEGILFNFALFSLYVERFTMSEMSCFRG